MVRDRIHVVNTKNVKDTAMFITQLYSRIKADPIKYVTVDKATNEENVVVKPRKVDAPTCFKLQLCQIPGVSLKTAAAITDRFQSWPQLIQDLSHKSHDEKLKVFKGLHTIDDKGKARRLSDKVSSNIIEYTFLHDHGSTTAANC
jgi:ERCC4-type nuclease